MAGSRNRGDEGDFQDSDSFPSTPPWPIPSVLCPSNIEDAKTEGCGGSGSGHSILAQQLFVTYAPQLRAYALALAGDFAAADDVVQEAFLAVTAKAAEFQPGPIFSPGPARSSVTKCRKTSGQADGFHRPGFFSRSTLVPATRWLVPVATWLVAVLVTSTGVAYTHRWATTSPALITVHREGFETPPPPGHDFQPEQFDAWGGDETEVVAGEAGIAPHGGSRMLKVQKQPPTE